MEDAIYDRDYNKGENKIRNERKDIGEFHEEITEGLEIVYVKDMNQVIKEALAAEPEKR